MNCERCTSQVNTLTGSYFNTQMICLPCADRERKHPLFPEAKRAEYEAVCTGNLNFPGIGAPQELLNLND